LKSISKPNDISTNKNGIYLINGKKYSFDVDEWEELLMEYGEHCWDKFSDILYDPEEFSDWSGGVLNEIESSNEPETKGVIELLWDVFGGTVNEQGYKVLDPHIGAIYGDSITLERAKAIFERLEAKGFASTNVVLGIGSFTYQFNTRDTFGFAMKATYVEVDGVGREIFKDPITDDGTKKSAKGLLSVFRDDNNEYQLHDQVDWATEDRGELTTIFKDGKYTNPITLTEVRSRVTENLIKEIPELR